MEPPGNENATGKGGALTENFSNDADSISDTQAACNSKSLPPGYSWEGGSIVPCELPPVQKLTLTDEQILLRVIGHACSWCDGHPAKWQAFLSVGGYDTRTSADVAESLEISQRSFQLHLKAAREWLADLRAELESEDK